MSADKSSGEIEKEEIEGLDTTLAEGWGSDYPLDAVFVRNEARTVSEVVKRIKGDRYQLDPEFQRDFVWPVEKQSRLIESCVMRIPLPVFYVAEDHDGRIAVVDGLQRLTTFYRFLGNEFSLYLKPGEDEPDHPLHGKRFRDLPLQLQERIEDTQLILYILEPNAPERAKLDIFERVNSGVPLTRQQMRNCLFNGPATAWLKRAANSDIFLKTTGRSLDRKSMRDREAINRFCAFSLLGFNEYKSADMDGFLAQALLKMNSGEIDLDDLYKQFIFSMEVNYRLFGDHAFRKSISDLDDPCAARKVINIALFDVCSVLFSRVDFGLIEEAYEEYVEVIQDLLLDEEFVHSITYSTNSTKQVKRRFELAYSAVFGVFE